MSVVKVEFAAQRRIAAKVMKCGESRVWMDPAKLGEIGQAITTADIRRLIASDVISAIQKTGLSTGRKKHNAAQKAKGRRKGKGSRKGKVGTRFSRKNSWIKRIRAQRSMLKEFLASSKIDKTTYKNMYAKAKGGYFRSRAHVQAYVDELSKSAIVAKEKLGKVGKSKKRSVENGVEE